ncbi:MAG TPA: hypothetical protein VHC44_00600 [Verrucomicrobiae bacterium]|nr:hypothetical protein [Verrucomicrobiae bacterium]
MKSLDRIGAIRQSLLVFFYGLASLLPIVGILPAAMSLVRGARLRRAVTGPNPADNYRKWGMALGVCGLLITIYTAMVIVAHILATLGNRDAFME